MPAMLKSSGSWKQLIQHIRGGSDAVHPNSDEDEGDAWGLEDSIRTIGFDLSGQLIDRRKGMVDSARTFLPRILQHPELGGKEGTVLHQCVGCVVFSDASGFTKLTETLAQKADGAEVLSKCLNKFFTPLIDIIEAYRGDVIKFSGDALSILFEATDDYDLHPCPCGSPEADKKTPNQLACLRASACCLEIHKRLHNFDTGEGDVRLTLHIGVGAGNLTILQVGGEHGRYEYVIAGTPMEQISIAEPLAGSGETVLSPQTWGEVEYTVVEGEKLTEGPPGYHRLLALDTRQHTYPTIKQAALECSRIQQARMNAMQDAELLQLSERFIPRAVLKHLRSGNNTSINEMRSVTIIFAQIGGVDVSTENGSKIAQDLMLGMQRACYHHEGNLNKFLVDDKGLLFLFVFGLPPLVHIDDPARAIAACFDMIGVLQGMGLVGRFGVTTGRVFCGIVGSDKRREYTVMGDTVNLSARLMAAAQPNSVLICEATSMRSRRDVECKQLEPIKVKGKANLIPIFAPRPPTVCGLLLEQLSAHLSQRSWDLQKTELEVQITTKRNTTETVDAMLPWRASSRLLGGTSPVLQLTRWHELKKLDQLLMGKKGLLKEGGGLCLFGLSGIGKQEMSEYLVSTGMDSQLVPLVGMMRSRPDEQWRAIASLVQNCIQVLHVQRGGCATLEDTAEQVLRIIAQKDRNLHQALGFLGFEGYQVPVERGASDARSDAEENIKLQEGCAEVAAALVKMIADLQGVVVVLRLRRGTDIYDSLRADGLASAFWRLSAKLTALATERQRAIAAGSAALKPIFVVTVARKRPDAGSPEAAILEAQPPTLAVPATRTRMGLKRDEDILPTPTSARLPQGVGAWEMQMAPLTEDAAVELMCHCLGLETTNGGSLVKRKLREFTLAVSISMPTYIQECLQHLMAASCVRVDKGECIIVQDLNTVNIAEWVHTSMVGGTISQLESLGSAKSHIMKLATVFEGPFSSLDLAAANRVLFGRLPRILAFYDQSKLMTAATELVQQGFLRRVPVSIHSQPADRAPAKLPRWTISNSLFRKVAGSMLLNSQRILIKRAVLLDRALNVELPKRIRPGQKGAGQVSNRHKAFIEDSSNDMLPDSKGFGLRTSGVDNSLFEPLQPSKTPEEAQEHADMLMSACALGNTAMVLQMLKMTDTIDINKATDVSGYTPLHFACSSGEVDIVHVLCEHNACVDMKSNKMETPLLVAAQRGHLEVVQYLCESRNALGSTSLHNLEYWERALPDVLTEDDIPRPIAPALQNQANIANYEVAMKKRREVQAWLASRLARDREDLSIRASIQTSQVSVRVSTAAASCKGMDVNNPTELPPARFKSRHTLAQHRASLAAANGLPPGNPPVWKENGRLSPKAVITRLVPTSLRNSALRAKVRVWLRGRTVLTVMLTALALALYIPDLLVSVGVVGNALNDVLLSFVMFLFLMELLLLSLVDASYPGSFFFFMDCIGTFSMVTDISYLLGSNADEAQKNQASDADLTFFRATRTAKLGARAGRLSRLVKVMRFLPGGSRNQENQQVEKLQQISNQLTNVLSKRVACLTILLVIFMPLFTLGLYPESDFSMQVWIESFSRRVAEGVVKDQATLMGLLSQFSSFYRGHAYGPYKVCLSGSDVPSDVRGCYVLADSGFEEPERTSFQLKVAPAGALAEAIVASFDFSAPTRAEARMGILLISLVIILMCGACTLLNYAASELAVRPLERMLTSIKGSAKAIFSSVSALASEDDAEDFGEDMDGEVALLERVVRKIATLAELSSKKNLFDEEAMKGMKSEELGVLALTATHHQRRHPVVVSEEAVELGRAQSGVTETMQWQLEEIGIAYELLNSWHFNVLDLTVLKQEQVSAWLLMNNPGSCAFTEQNVDMKRLRSFVSTINKGYWHNTYHNFMHAVDVTHTAFRYMNLMQAELLFTMMEQFSVLVASLSHDLGHIGLNNGFLVEVQHELAIRYNDKSPLENLHCCKLFEILAQPSVNVFQGTAPDQFRDARKLIIEVILHTDITLHPAMVKELELLYEMNSKVFEHSSGTLTEREIEVLSTSENKKLTAKVLLHAADTSNPTKPWEIARAWAWRVLDEYADQGDQEKKIGIPVQMLNDREKVNRPNSQIGFIEFIITPLVAAEVKIFPSWYEAAALLEENVRRWEHLWIEESNPSEVEREKVKERVLKMSQKLSTKAFGAIDSVPASIADTPRSTSRRR